MSYLNIYDSKLDEYYLWVKKQEIILTVVEDNILQKDSSDAIQEKLLSIGFSSILVSIGTGIMSIFGLAFLAVGGGVVLFIIGLFLSKGINNKVFGKEREIEDISEEEKILLDYKNNLQNFFRPIKKKLTIKKLRHQVAFTNYLDIKNNITSFSEELQKFTPDNLAMKYRYRYNKSIQDYIIHASKFDKIYTNN